jgi:transposase
MQTLSGQDAFSNLICSYEYHREQLLTLSRQVRIRIREYDNELYFLLKTISGIGPLTSSALITELGDINRFPHIDHLNSFVGLIPRVKQSGETSRTGGITFRCNSFLRTLIIEASWQAIRQDPGLMQYYHQHLINTVRVSMRGTLKLSRCENCPVRDINVCPSRLIYWSLSDHDISVNKKLS